MSEFYVYTHARPDGRVFYVGKGMDRRAWDMAPSRRKAWHMNIVRKHGRENILVKTYPVQSEAEAFELEMFMISEYRNAGIPLVNLTVGGEGCSGRKLSEKQRAALEKGRGKDRALSAEAKKAIADGLARGRQKFAAGWSKSEKAREHLERIVRMSVEIRAAKTPIELICCHCGVAFKAKHHNARYCGDICNQRYWRAVRAANRVPDKASIPV